VTELEAELATAKSTAAAVQAKSDSLVLHSAVAQAFLGAGGKTDAVDFIVSEASKTFKVADGKSRPRNLALPARSFRSRLGSCSKANRTTAISSRQQAVEPHPRKAAVELLTAARL